MPPMTLALILYLSFCTVPGPYAVRFCPVFFFARASFFAYFFSIILVNCCRLLPAVCCGLVLTQSHDKVRVWNASSSRALTAASRETKSAGGSVRG